MVSHVRGVWQYRFFWIALVKMDLMTRYRKSVLGIGWSLVYPLAMTAVFCVVFSTLFNSSSWRDYAQNTLAGMTMWEFLKGCMSQGCTALTRSEAYIRQAPLPYAIYPLRVVLGNAFHFLMSMLVLGLLVATLNSQGLTWAALWVIPAMLLAVVFAWALSTLTAFATAFFHDVTHMVEVGTQILFFLTPIIYEKKALKDLAWTADYNPFAVFIEMLREPLVHGRMAPGEIYLSAGTFTLAAFALAVGTIAWLQKKVIFHL
jgi:ABC-type polysaccharide/polyol phosphate export permease